MLTRASGRLLRAAAVIGAMPALALLVLILAGAADPWPALAAIVAVALASFALAFAWTRDLALLEGVVRRSPPAGQPLLSPLARLADDLGRLSETLLGRIERLEQQRQADRAIWERLPDPLIVLGADYAARRLNAATRTVLGAEISSVLRHPAIRGAIDRALAEGSAEIGELSLPVPVARELQVTAIGLDPPLEDGGRVLLVLSDRTRERAVERMRADFVANASHELRTPLASLIGFIDTLRGPAADDLAAQRRFLAIMAEQAARMQRLIDDLLSLSRIELIEHQTPTARVDLAALVGRVAAGFEPALAVRGATLDLDLAPGLSEIPGDADQLAQVLQNLLDNALKYGRQGGRVRLTAGPTRPGDSWPARPGVVFAVADDGPGIPRAHIPRLTERFYRVDPSRSRAAGGTGLGLAIAKHIVNRHRGQLRIESTEGAGATFSVWLPATPAEGPRLPVAG